MLYAAAIAVLSLAASLCLTLAGWGPRVAVVHLAFAVGVVPLIFAGMTHFVPVLTRTGDPGRLIGRLPFFAQVAGGLAVAALAGWVPRNVVHGAAAVDLVLAAILLRWMLARARLSFGSPHPGWRWYGAALACLIGALLAVPPLTAIPGLYAPLRALHLHLNTLGLVGLAALGTLPVLLPTALGQADPAAALWLRTRLWPTLVGIVLVAVGSSIAWPLALAGAGILLAVLYGLLRHWVHHFGWKAVLQDGVACSLFAAGLGLGLVLFGGMLHGIGRTAAYPTIAVWAAAFLLPLVTGALSQLLPVWCWPGPSSPARVAMRRKLVATGRGRAGLFLSAGLLLMLGWTSIGGAFAATGVLLFLIGLIQAVRVARSTR